MMGRPTAYNEEVQATAEEYVENFTPTNDEAIPTVAGLAQKIGVCKKTVHNWANDDNPEFLHLYERLMDKQEVMLMSGGLKGTYNATMAKLGLTKHGYTDKIDQTNTDKINVKDLTEEQLAYIAEHGKLPPA